MAMTDAYRPPRGLRNGHLQTLLGSSALRRIGLRATLRALARTARHEVLDLPGGVRLSGHANTQQALAQRRGLVVLLHGWEGSAQSNYVVASAAALLRAGYDVFRLNFRDHGDSHALNDAPFHSCRLDEVVDAVALLCARPGAGLRAVAGFSLGGNFALRVARAAPARGIALDCALAVCPLVDPAHGLRQLERGWLYHAYFMRKWRGSLRHKQRLFPQQPVLLPGERRLDMRALTRQLVLRYTDFGSLEAYLEGYSIAGARLATLQVPCSILTAADDPVIPVADFRALQLPPCVELQITPHGGHCAFLADWRLRSSVPGYLCARLDARAAQLASAHLVAQPPVPRRA